MKQQSTPINHHRYFHLVDPRLGPQLQHRMGPLSYQSVPILVDHFVSRLRGLLQLDSNRRMELGQGTGS